MASRARRHELKNAVPPTISRKLFDGGIVEVAPVALEDELLLMHGDSFWIILVQQLGQQEINAVTGQCALGARCGVPSSLPLCRIFPPATQSICCIPMTPSAKAMANSWTSTNKSHSQRRFRQWSFQRGLQARLQLPAMFIAQLSATRVSIVVSIPVPIYSRAIRTK